MKRPAYLKEEFARRGDEIYERNLRSMVEPAHRCKFIAIDIETGAYEIDEDDYTATKRLLARYPDSQIWLTGVGYRYAHCIGRWAGA